MENQKQPGFDLGKGLNRRKLEYPGKQSLTPTSSLFVKPILLLLCASKYITRCPRMNASKEGKNCKLSYSIIHKQKEDE